MMNKNIKMNCDELIFGFRGFSRNGGIPQESYAEKAKHAENVTTIGIMNEECAVVMTHKPPPVEDGDFPDLEHVERIKILRERTGGVFSGKMADGESLMENARIKFISYFENFGYDLTLRKLSNAMGEHMRCGCRPLATDIILASYEDNKLSLCKLRQGGTAEWNNIVAGGKEEEAALKMLKEADKKNFDKEESVILLLLKCLKEVAKIPNEKYIEMGIVSKQCPEFRILTSDEIGSYFDDDDDDETECQHSSNDDNA